MLKSYRRAHCLSVVLVLFYLAVMQAQLIIVRGYGTIISYINLVYDSICCSSYTGELLRGCYHLL